MASVATYSPNPAGQGEIDTFLRWDTIGTVGGLVIAGGANLIWVREPALWIVIAALAALLSALVLARRQHEVGSLLTTLALVTAGNWIVALTVPLALPFLWPVMIVTVLMPIVLAAPYLPRLAVMPTLLTSALTAGAVAVIGLLNDDGGAIRDIDDNYELLLVIGGLMVQIIPIGLIVWQSNQLQQASFDQLRQSEHELAQSRNRVVAAADTERRRIERDLHDGAQQRLVSLGVRLRLLESQVQEDASTLTSVRGLVDELDAAVEDVREVAHGIYPPLLQTRGLAAALTAVVRRSPLEIHADVDDIGRLDEGREIALYFAALEALTNAAKHAPDSRVDLSVVDEDGVIVLSVNDDGPGFDLETSRTSHGITNMSDRLAAVAGTFTINSEPGAGTDVVARVPR